MLGAGIYAAVRKGNESKNSLRWVKKEVGKLDSEQWVDERPALVP